MADEKPSYAQINRKVWNTCQFRGLSREARELFFYLTTCPHGNMLGIFVLRPGYVLDDLQWGPDRERFREPFNELLDKGLFKYDPRAEIILDMEQLEKHPPINPNQVTATIKIVNSLPKTPLFNDLKLLAESLGKPLLEPLIKRLGERYAYSVTVTVTESVTETAMVPETISPVDNSPSKEAFLQKYQELGEDISALFTDQRQQRQIALFVEAHIKNGNLQAIIHCLESLLSSQRKNQVINPKAYLEKIFAVENGNFNEQENIARSDAHKKDFTSIGDVFAGMKGREPWNTNAANDF